MLKLIENRSNFAGGIIPAPLTYLLDLAQMIDKENRMQDRDGLPPFVRSWKQLYTVLIGALLLQIVLFYLFMTHFQ